MGDLQYHAKRRVFRSLDLREFGEKNQLDDIIRTITDRRI